MNVGEIINAIQGTDSWVLRTAIARREIGGIKNLEQRKRVADAVLKRFGNAEDGILPEIGRPGFHLGVWMARSGG